MHISVKTDDLQRQNQQSSEDTDLRLSELKYRRLFETAMDGILILDGDTGEIYDANNFILDKLGYPLDYFRGKQLWELGFIKDKSFAQKAFAYLKENSYIRYEDLPLVTRDGRNLEVEFISNVYRVNNRTIIQCNIRDITERKRVEKALALARMKLNLLYGITRHDINNQLMVLMGYISILEEKQTDPALLEYFGKLTTAAQRISAMIQFTKDYEQVGLNAPVWLECRTLVHTAAKEAPLGQIMVKNDLPAGTRVFADPMILKVFYNLIDNAVRYGKKITTVRIFLEERDGNLVVVCEDDGGGIIPEDKERIFERGVGKNTGLGLTISRDILGITGITIRETGEPGTGARFEITVPEGAYWFAGEPASS
jgi:PAS domain S-box-containing protein